MIVDTETTGLAAHDEPISVGAVLFEVDLPKGGHVREIGSYYGLRAPGVAISPGAFAVHGIPASSLAGHQFDDVRLNALIDQAEYIVAHNAAFDRRMLAQVYPSIWGKRWRCSYRQIWWSDHIDIPNRKLDTICSHFEIARPNPHNALDDCRALADALFRRTGTTTRSRTFLGVALSKGELEAVDTPHRAKLPDDFVHVSIPLPDPVAPADPGAFLREKYRQQQPEHNSDVPQSKPSPSWLGLAIWFVVLLAGFLAALLAWRN